MTGCVQMNKRIGPATTQQSPTTGCARIQGDGTLRRKSRRRNAREPLCASASQHRLLECPVVTNGTGDIGRECSAQDAAPFELLQNGPVHQHVHVAPADADAHRADHGPLRRRDRLSSRAQGRKRVEAKKGKRGERRNRKGAGEGSKQVGKDEQIEEIDGG
eukprot:185182-Pleurochrysis_carterae.AAC.1